MLAWLKSTFLPGLECPRRNIPTEFTQGPVYRCDNVPILCRKIHWLRYGRMSFPGIPDPPPQRFWGHSGPFRNSPDRRPVRGITLHMIQDQPDRFILGHRLELPWLGAPPAAKRAGERHPSHRRGSAPNPGWFTPPPPQPRTCIAVHGTLDPSWRSPDPKGWRLHRQPKRRTP